MGPKIEARPITAADEALIGAWLRDPEVHAWFGDAASAEAAVRLARTSDAALARIITADGAPIGYGQAIDGALMGDAAAAEPGVWHVDAFIGDAPLRGRGLGASVLDAIAREVLGSTLALAVSMLVPVRHERVVRAAETAGFRWSAVREDPSLGRCWLMVRRRP